VPLLANEYIELMALASVNSEYVLDYNVGSGAGATARPATPACIVSVKGWNDYIELTASASVN